MTTNVAVRLDYLWLSFALLGLIDAAQTGWMANPLSLISGSSGRQNGPNRFTGRMVQTIGYTPVFTAFSCLHRIGFAVLVYASGRAARPAAFRPA